MSQTEIINLITEIEEKFSVDKWKVDGMHIWPIIRINISNELFQYSNKSDKIITTKPSIIATVNKAGNLLKGLASFFKAYFSDNKHNKKPEKGFDTVFLNHSTCRLFKVDGRMYDVFCDPYISVLESLQIKSFVMEYAPGNEYRIPRYGSSMFIDLAILYARIRALVFKKSITNLSEVEKNYHALKTFLSSRVDGFTFDRNDDIWYQIKYIRFLASFYKNKFSILNPQVGLVVWYYGNEGMAFNLACREFGIPSMDIQHGVQGSEHAAYGQWNSVPDDGYELLPASFLCWSDEDANVIKGWNRKVAKWHFPIVLGNLYMNMFTDFNNPIVKYYQSVINNITGKNKNGLNIIITLQTGRGVREIFKEVIVCSPPSWFWWIRLHPSMHGEKEVINKDLKSLKVNNYNLKDASELPLYGLLPKMDVHITEWSSTTIETSQFGIPTVLTHANGGEIYSDLISSGIATLALSKDDIIKSITDQAKRKKANEFESFSKSHEYEKSVLAINLLVAKFYRSANNQFIGAH